MFADVKADDLTLDPASFEAHITPRTKAVVPVHLYGEPCDMDPIMAIAKKHGIKVVEDVSHAQGGLYKGRKLGTIGDCGAMSLMTGKSFAIGEGGMLVTNPIPEEYAMDDAVINKAIDEAIDEMNAKGIHGKEATPFLLAKVKDLTGGDSLDSNIHLVFNNAKVASQIAACLCKIG